MAERRMFAKTIIDSDAFLEMPATSQLLYFHLSMRADDDGFVNKPKSLMRMVGCKDDDLKLLFAKKFLIPFESGVVVIKHWKIHNYIAKDRYTETKYKEEKATLMLDENNAYTQAVDGLYTGCIQGVDKSETQDRLGKVREGKDRVGEVIVDAPDMDVGHKTTRRHFVPPTVEEVAAYCRERGNRINAQQFVDHYASNGWVVGHSKMKDWRAAVRTWEHRDNANCSSKTTAPPIPGTIHC